MGTTNNRSPLPQYVTTLIQITVHRTIGRYRFTESDQDDLEQQITLEVIRRRPAFDPTKAQENTFLARVVKNTIADIIAARKAACRDYRREEGSLSRWVLVEGDSSHPLHNEWATRGELVTEQDARLHLGKGSIDPEELGDLAIDLSDAAATLPDRLRNVYEHLRELGTVQDVANAMGLHRSSVYDAIKEIRTHCEEAGLGGYLPGPRPDRFNRPPVGNGGEPSNHVGSERIG